MALLRGCSERSPLFLANRFDGRLGIDETVAVDVRDPVNMLDLRVSIGNEQWTASAWGRNVLDEFYWQDFNALEFGAPGIDLGSPSPPDTYGVEVRNRF